MTDVTTSTPGADDVAAEVVLILGVGNLLLGDDGAGVHAAQRLQEDPAGLTETTRIMDGGTFGLDLAPHLYDVDRLVIVDAVAHGGAPGHVGIWRGEAVARMFQNPLSVHQVGVDALLGALILLGAIPPEVHLVGVEPEDLEPGVGLSPAVAAAMPELLATVVQAAGGRSEGDAPRSRLRPIGRDLSAVVGGVPRV